MAGDGVEIGTAYVTILPDGSKIAPEVKKSFGAVDAEAAKVGQTSGKRFGGMFSRNSVTGVDQAGTKAGKRFGGLFSSTATKVIGAAGGLLAVSKLTNFLGDSLDEAREAAQVGRRTENVIKSMGNASKVTAKQVGNLSSAISNRVGVDDEAIQSGANLLLTFGKVRNEAGKGNKVFNRATTLMADMSAAMGTDMKGSAIQLGKALNDPVKGLSALSRVGVSFNETQKQTVKSLIEGGDKNAVFAMQLVKSGEEWSDALKANKGDIAATVESLTKNLSDAQKKRYDFLAEGGHQLEAQKIILGEVDKQFKGAGKAMADPAKKLSVAYGNLKEQIGTALLPTAQDLERFMTNKVIPAVSTFLDQMQTGKGKGGRAAQLFRDIRDNAEKAWGFIRKVGNGFNDLPSPLKKGILIGGGSLLAANKIAGGLSGLRGATPATPMFVSVVGGLPKTPTKTPLGKVAPAAAAASTVAAAAAASALIVGGNKKLAPKSGIYGSPTGGPTGGWKASDLKNPFGGFLSDLTGSKGQKALGVLGSIDHAVDGLTGKTDDWRSSIRGVNKYLGILDAKHPYVEITSNIPAISRALDGVGHQLDALTERRARIRLAISQNGEGFGLQKRETGGPVRRGVPYIVGERRPEVFVPDQNGRIESRVSRGGGPTFNIGQIVAQDVNHLTRELQARAQRAAMGGF